MESDSGPKLDLDALMAMVEAERKRIAPLLPDIDPGDLHAILVAMFRPWGSGRRFLLKQVAPGVNVF